jgi:hypothetical protein
MESDHLRPDPVTRRLLGRRGLRLLLLLLLLLCGRAAAEDEGVVAALEDEVLQETLAAGRGERDHVGVRDQWESQEHLGGASKFDTRKPPSAHVQGLLRDYRLTCEACDHDEAVAKINAFVRDAKRHAQAQASQQTWMERAAAVVVVVGVGVAGYLLATGQGKHKDSPTTTTTGSRLGSAKGGSSLADRQRRAEIAEGRRLAAMKMEEDFQRTVPAKAAPTWWENEEKEVWTPQQEKQFAKALVAFGGIPPKQRYPLMADKVDDKTNKECLMHHKLQQWIAKQQ